MAVEVIANLVGDPESIVVTEGAKWTLEDYVLHVQDESGKSVATFYDWRSVRVVKSAGPFTDCCKLHRFNPHIGH